MIFPASTILLIAALSLAAGCLISVAVGSLADGDADMNTIPAPDHGTDHNAMQVSTCRRPVKPNRLFMAATLASLGAAFWSFAVLPDPLSWAGCVLGWMLIAAAMIDLRHYWLPDGLILPLIPAGLLVSWLMTGAITEQVLGVVAGYSSLAAIRHLYRRLRGCEGVGLGDVKLLAASGAWVGWAGLSSVVLIASVAALCVGLASFSCCRHRSAKDKPIAFGPYLAIGFWIVWLHGPLTFG